MLYVAVGRQLPRAALALVVVTAPLEVYRVSVAGVNLSLFRLSVGLAGAVVLFALLRRRRAASAARSLVPAHREPVVAVYAAIALAIGASLLVNPINTFLGARLMATVLVGLLALGVVWQLARDVPRGDLAMLLAAAAVLPLAAAAREAIAIAAGSGAALPFLAALPVDEGLEKSRATSGFVGDLIRMRGTFADSNHFGTFLVFGLAGAVAAAVTAALRGRRAAAVAAGALAVAATAGILGSYSRTAWLAAGVATLVAAALLYSVARQVRVRRPMLLLAGAAAIALAAVPIAPHVLDRLDPRADVNEVSNFSHGETVRAAIREFERNPVFGIGVGGLGKRLTQGPRTSGAHSSYLTVAAELGLVGLALLLAAAVLVVRRLLRRRAEQADPLIACLAAAYIGYLAANVVYDLWWDDFHWVVLGLVLAATSPARAPDAPATLPREGRTAAAA